jgi:hypothetical protein
LSAVLIFGIRGRPPEECLQSRRRVMRKIVVLLTLCFLCLSSTAAFAQIDEGLITIGDLVISRPVGIVVTVVGSALFVVSLPFALTSGSVKETADVLVGQPFKFTFTRPLGNFKEYHLYGSYEKKGKEHKAKEEEKKSEK